MLVFTLAFARIFRLTCDAHDFSDRCGVSICAFVQYNNIIGYLVSGAGACVRYLIEAPKIADKPSRTMCIASHSQQNARILAHKYARITPTFRVPAMHALSPTENKTTAYRLWHKIQFMIWPPMCSCWRRVFVVVVIVVFFVYSTVQMLSNVTKLWTSTLVQ